VDDVTGICSSEEEELDLKAGIQKYYKIKEKDTTKPFKVLGILVTRDTHEGSLKMSQSEYIESLLQRFDMMDCNPVVTLVDKVHTYKKAKQHCSKTKSSTRHSLVPSHMLLCQRGLTSVT